MGLLPKRMRNNPVSAASSSPSFQAMIDKINEVQTGDVAKLSDPRSVSPAMRLSLATFLEEWTESDVGHEKYIGNLLSGFEANEGIKMGDLLEWMAIGTDNQFDNEVSMPKGVDHKELVGLHAELLDFLPLKSYNTFTMVTLLEDDPELVEEVFNNYVELTATEHDALQALSTIVKRGSIESIRLLLEASPKHGDRGYGFTQTDNYGSLLVDTFELCRRASVAYKDGNYMGAKALIGQLFDEKGIDAELVRMDIGKMAPMKLTIVGGGGERGPGELVLVSPMYADLDQKQIISKGASSTFADSASEAVRVTVLGAKYDYQKKGQTLYGRKLEDYDDDVESAKASRQFGVSGTSPEEVTAKLNKKLTAAGTSVEALEKATANDIEWSVKIMPNKKNTGEWKALSARIGDRETDDDDDDEVATEAPESVVSEKLDQAGVLDLVRKFGNESREQNDENQNQNQNQGGGNKKKAKVVQVLAQSILEGIYGKGLKQGQQAKFVIHAILSGSSKISSDLIPKGTVTFSVNQKTNKDGKTGSHVNMVVEWLPGNEVEGKALFRTEVDPINTAIEAANVETRRNPSSLECGKCGAQPGFNEITTIEKGAKHPFTGKMAKSQVMIHAGCGGNLRGVMGPRNNPSYGTWEYKPSKLKKHVSEKPWIYPGQTIHASTFETFLEAKNTIISDYSEWQNYWFANAQGNDINVYVKDGDKYKNIGTLILRRKLGSSPSVLSNPKGGGKKRISAVGNTYAIDLIPRSSIKLTQKDIKYSNKLLHKWRDSSAEMKAFWKKYTATGSGGGNTVYAASKAINSKWILMKKGQTWNPNRPPLNPEMIDEFKEWLPTSRFSDRKHFIKNEMKGLIKRGGLIPKPGTQQKGQTGGSYVTYKGGKTGMKMILARHKVSGSLVPYRLLVPAAAFRMEGDTIVPRSGSADSKGAKQLLELIELTFGKVKFHKNMGKGALKVGEISLDEGVAKIFKTGGIRISDEFSDSGAMARPYLYDDKRLTYIAKGRQYTMEVF